MSDPTCTHSWQSCPIHSLPNGELPGLQTVLLCVYGGVETKAGTPFDEEDARQVTDRVIERLWGDLDE